MRLQEIAGWGVAIIATLGIIWALFFPLIDTWREERKIKKIAEKQRGAK